MPLVLTNRRLRADEGLRERLSRLAGEALVQVQPVLAALVWGISAFFVRGGKLFGLSLLLIFAPGTLLLWKVCAWRACGWSTQAEVRTKEKTANRFDRVSAQILSLILIHFSTFTFLKCSSATMQLNFPNSSCGFDTEFVAVMSACIKSNPRTQFCRVLYVA